MLEKKRSFLHEFKIGQKTYERVYPELTQQQAIGCAKSHSEYMDKVETRSKAIEKINSKYSRKW